MFDCGGDCVNCWQYCCSRHCQLKTHCYAVADGQGGCVGAADDADGDDEGVVVVADGVAVGGDAVAATDAS